MERQDVAILINSTPKYFYLLPLQTTMIRRYATELKCPIFLATEKVQDDIILKVAVENNIRILSLREADSGFLESRLAALEKLPSDITYVLPLQEDFLLDRAPDYSALKDALFILDTDRNVSSLRLNPCPGPHVDDVLYTKEKKWKILSDKDQYIFTYQATLWRKMDLITYYKELLSQIEKETVGATEQRKKELALTMNLGESGFGQKILKRILPDVLHLSCPRVGKWSNAVYLCPWPYRPTAVTRGKLEPFAEELFQREGIKFEKPVGNMMM